ncbi:hypothetical protein [Undibacterium sp. TJN19]|uniref:hypothetical protein n=1 Tax=Undibacterium sp. TJN19 TaxID=3413055 RepID=UPI003BEFF522
MSEFIFHPETSQGDNHVSAYGLVPLYRLLRKFCYGLGFSIMAGSVMAAPCDIPAMREFDFWLGEWQVHTPDGKLAGTNSISREYSGCVIHERYMTGRGYSGESLNIYDAPRKIWHQTWVDDTGTLLLLEGGLQGANMVLEGQNLAAEGHTVRHRISWMPNANGSVRQLWESTDARGVWTVAFDGLYTKNIKK